MLDDFDRDQDKAEHIWNGAYGAGQGAILARWINQAERDGRITDELEFDPNAGPLEISCDLGFRDTASFWYWQRMLGGFHLLKYDGDTGLDADDWIPRIKSNVLEIGAKKEHIWLPHDARAKTFQSKETTIERFIKAFGVGNCDIVPQSKKADQISAARSVISKCAFHRANCEDGIDGLMAWEFEYNEENGVFSREPLHNWASHPSDAFAYGCQVMQEHSLKPSDKPIIWPVQAVNGIIQTAPLNELWKEIPRKSNRI
jgi:phage terminase large subunit